MGKVFEDYFSEIQADMVSICLENVENRAEKIYVYGSCEYGHVTSFYFYKINGMIVSRSKLNDAIPSSDVQYDVSRQSQVLDVLNGDIWRIDEVCKKFDQQIPTELKIIYDVATNKLKADDTDTLFIIGMGLVLVGALAMVVMIRKNETVRQKPMRLMKTSL